MQNPVTHLSYILDGSDMLPYGLMILWVTLKTQFLNSKTRQRWPENKAIDILETHFHLTTMEWSFILFQLKMTHRLDVLCGKHVMSSYKTVHEGKSRFVKCAFKKKDGVIKSSATLKDSFEPLIWDNVCLANMEMYNFFIKLPPTFTLSKNFGEK